ncbi:MAG TPA: hypothetical protein PKX92_11695 [Edaphocola sp.]|nr:hypothetical protein [Edaphocola sp.]
MHSELNPLGNIPTRARRVEKKAAPLNKMLLGFLIGLMTGIIGVLLVYIILYQKYTFESYVDLFLPGKISYALAGKSISLAMIFNLLPFYLFLNKKYYLATKGVIFATGLLGILFILYKFVW